jgi:hypothetical protein
MVSTALVYQARFQKSLDEAYVHLARMDEAFDELGKNYQFPIEQEQFIKLLTSRIGLAFADQIIYRFSKAQDTIGAKLFKAFLLFQGENVDRPFLDILNELEKLHIVDVEGWFILREIRNDIAHDYENNQDPTRLILNNIFQYRGELKQILVEIEQKTGVPSDKQ